MENSIICSALFAPFDVETFANAKQLGQIHVELSIAATWKIERKTSITDNKRNLIHSWYGESYDNAAERPNSKA